MNVGVYLFNVTPDVGGGYSFQLDIFQALVDLAAESRHTFTVFCTRPENIRPLVTSDRVRVVQILEEGIESSNSGPSQKPPSSLSRALLQRAANSINYRFTLGQRPPQKTSKFDQVVNEAGIEFMWFVSGGGRPETSISLEIPYLATVWDLQHRLQPWFPEVSQNGVWDLREEFYSKFLRRASIVIVGTEAGREEIERFYQVTPDRIRILPHPTPRFALDAPPKKETKALSKYDIPSGYLFYPAQFWAHKNHSTLLHAVGILRDQYDLFFPVVFVGSDKGNQEYIRCLAEELQLGSQVYFLGFVAQEDLISLYRNAFALTYLSFFGPENLPPLEAFALGCPVVASAVSGAREQLGDAALLVEPKNPDQIAGAIKALYDDPELRQKLAARGLERASRWNGSDFVKGVFSVFDEFELLRHCWGKY
jgi:glycosyltransferase involved in cell wall biosynthesis